MPTQFGSIQDNLITSNIENNKILHSNFAHKPCQWHVPVITESPDCFRPFFPQTHIDRNNGTRERCIANITEIRRYNGEIQPLLARGFLSAPLAITHLSVSPAGEPHTTNHRGCGGDALCIFIIAPKRILTVQYLERGCFSFTGLIYLEVP